MYHMYKLKYVPPPPKKKRFCADNTWFTNWPSYWTNLRRGREGIKNDICIAKIIPLHVIFSFTMKKNFQDQFNLKEI